MATYKQQQSTMPSWVNDVVAGTVGGWAQVISGTFNSRLPMDQLTKFLAFSDLHSKGTKVHGYLQGS